MIHLIHRMYTYPLAWTGSPAGVCRLTEQTVRLARRWCSRWISFYCFLDPPV